MCGSPALVLGIGRQFVEGDEHWTKIQKYTLEEYLNIKYEYKEGLTRFKSQEDADKEANHMQELARSYTRFQGKTLYFSSIDKTVEIAGPSHEFNFNDAKNVEITLDQMKLLIKELNRDQWQDFDLETWAK